MVSPHSYKAFRTVDGMVDHFTTNWKSDHVYTDIEICYLVITYTPNILVNTLTSEANVPSKYDLILIKFILEYDEKVKDFQHRKILEIYKDRKNQNGSDTKRLSPNSV